ncbi:MAG: hypothetical protein DRG78_07100, partial [Epsilonproteobacteria bacterium]
MNYYNITLLGSPLETFTYHFSQTIKIGAKVSFNFRNRVVDGVVLSSCEKPSFETNEVLEVSDFFYSLAQIKLAEFISKYYFSSLGEALGLMVAFGGEYEGSDEIPNQVWNDGGVVLNDGGVVLNDGGVVLSSTSGE